MNRPTTSPTDNIRTPTGDLFCTHAQNLPRQLAHANWEPAVKLQEAVDLYSEVRLVVTMANGADGLLLVIDEKGPQKVNFNDWPPAPETDRSAHDG